MSNINLIEDANFTYTSDLQEGLLSLKSLDEYNNLHLQSLIRKEKSLHQVAMEANFLDDNKPIKSLKSLFPLFQTLAI